MRSQKEYRLQGSSRRGSKMTDTWKLRKAPTAITMNRLMSNSQKEKPALVREQN